MLTSAHRFAGYDEAFMPYRHLAIRVLACALRDVADPAGSQTDRESARLFFAGSPMLLHWCRVAALDPCLVAKHAAKFTKPTRPVDAGANPPGVAWVRGSKRVHSLYPLSRGRPGGAVPD